jgi:sulfite reductase (NADPH) flavoprotein alpha-component
MNEQAFPVLPRTTNAPLIPESAPFTAAQRAWLNGFLAALFSASGSPAPVEPGGPRAAVSVFFGTESGNAESLAKRLGKAVRGAGFEVEVKSLDTVAPVDLSEKKHALFIVSTFGDGDPPANAAMFMESLGKDDSPDLSNLQYAVCALGDTNYERFCQCGKDLDVRLSSLGAKRLYARVDCDVDFEKPFEGWQQGVLGVLNAIARGGGVQEFGVTRTGSSVSREATHGAVHLASSGVQESGVQESRSSGGSGAEVATEQLVYTRKNPYPARLLNNRRLTANGSGKETRHFEIELAGSGLSYEPGDALGVFPTNCPQLVDDLLRALNCDGEEAVPGPEESEIPLRKALTEYYDITRISRELLKEISSRSGDPRLVDDYLWGREPIDLLHEFPSATFPAAEFVQFLKKLQARLYSIASSLRAHPGQVHLTVSIVRYTSHGRARKGVCSAFLADRAGNTVPVFIQVSRTFRLPADPDIPIVMVGPGTGVAPFRAFLQERRGGRGQNWLFFGEQHAATDFFYRDEFEAMLAEGHLTKLTTAFSRDQTDKIYVQHRMLEHGRGLWDWLEQGAHFYVCGDASRMAKAVDAALHLVVETAGGLSKDRAIDYVQGLKAGKRYQRDVY